jgi:predicted acetyltransferase
MTALLASIVGYACVRQSRIVELVTARTHAAASLELLARLCGDAREQDGWAIRYDAPANDPLHAVLTRAGGGLHTTEGSSADVLMARIFDPLAVLRKLTPVLLQRSKAVDCRAAWELGLEVRAPGESAGNGKLNGVCNPTAGVVERYRIKIQPSEAVIETGGPSRQMIALGVQDLTPLLLGYLGAEQLAEAGRLKAASAKALSLATALFPGNLWSRPILDDLLA